MGKSGNLNWPTTREQALHMAERKAENIARSKHNPNEFWMAAKLRPTGLKWSRQAVWGSRIFDFWCAQKGIDVEVDGPEYRQAWDKLRDDHNYKVSQIIVLHVRNRNEDDAVVALECIRDTDT